MLPASVASSLRIQQIPNLVFVFGGPIDLGPVQLIHISLPDVNDCPPSVAVQSAGILPGGSDEGVAGLTTGPVQRNWAGWLGWWHGPHASQAWPLAAAFPGAPLSVLGDFTAVAGLSGSWVRPLQEYVEVSAVGVPVSWSVDSAVPAPSGQDPLTWRSRTPVTPLARLTDGPSLALLQNWVVIFAIVFGITGSLLASLLFEWLRPHRDDDSTTGGSRTGTSAVPASAAPAAQAGSGVPVSGLGRWLAMAGAVIVVSYVRGRLARGRSRRP